jgi:hypothetical protein
VSAEPVAREPGWIVCACGAWHLCMEYTASTTARCCLCERQARYVVLGAVDLCEIHLRALERDLGRVQT